MKKLKIKLFGKRKPKKHSIENLFNIKLIETINYNEFKDHESEIIDNRFDGVPFLPRGKFNYSIPNRLLSQLPFHLQRCWNRIDLEEYFRKPEPPIPPEIMGMTKSPVDILKMVSDDKKAKIKAFVLGELDK